MPKIALRTKLRLNYMFPITKGDHISPPNVCVVAAAAFRKKKRDLHFFDNKVGSPIKATHGIQHDKSRSFGDELGRARV